MSVPQRSTAQYVSARAPARWVLALLALLVGVDLLVVIADYSLANLIYGASLGQVITPVELSAKGSWVWFLGIIKLVIGSCAGVVFLVWLYRAYRNLRALGAQGLTGGPVRAVLTFSYRL